jgi:hypothetical protein
MLIEVDSKTYIRYFPINPHPFISDPFIELNSDKTERVVRLVEETDKPVIGLIAGIKNGVLYSPFSAPFGGFHFRNEVIYVSEIDSFITSLQAYLLSQDLEGIEITLPPDIYHSTFNAKTVNSLIRNGFQPQVPEITNWVNLQNFTGSFLRSNSREYYRQAVRNGLSFEPVYDEAEKKEVYDLICKNREKFGRPIYMTFSEIQKTGDLWLADFFKVITIDGNIVASSICYRSHPEICYAVFWGDNEAGRPLRAMDFISFNLWSHYKSLGFKYIDLGISTESGNPNEGLLRFKESHEATSSLRYRFLWQNNMIRVKTSGQ